MFRNNKISIDRLNNGVIDSEYKFRNARRQKHFRKQGINMELNFDYSKLKGRIKEICNTQDALAEKIGLGRVTLSQRLNNLSFFSQEEIMKICKALLIDPADIPIYFFAEKV